MTLEELLKAAPKGPWRLKTKPDLLYLEVLDADGEVVCNDNGGWNDSMPVSLDSARLIALAPTIAAALIEARRALMFYAEPCDGTDDIPCGYYGNMCCKTAHAAIARIDAITGGGDE